jgi:hypothetical protein
VSGSQPLEHRQRRSRFPCRRRHATGLRQHARECEPGLRLLERRRSAAKRVDRILQRLSRRLEVGCGRQRQPTCKACRSTRDRGIDLRRQLVDVLDEAAHVAAIAERHLRSKQGVVTADGAKSVRRDEWPLRHRLRRAQATPIRAALVGADDDGQAFHRDLLGILLHDPSLAIARGDGLAQAGHFREPRRNGPNGPRALRAGARDVAGLA